MEKDKIKKYLNFKYFSLVRQLLVKGQYRHTTNIPTGPDKGKPLITTTFYIDGDALNVLYLKNDELMLEEYPDKFIEHKSFLKSKIETMDIFSEHIKWFSTIFFTLFSLIIQTGDILWQLGLAGAFALAGYFFRKYIFRFALWIAKKVSSSFIGKFKFG